jgi:hypothetical protein
MANATANTTSWNSPNYVGQLYMVGSDNKTPFLNMIGGLEGGQVRTVKDFQFPVAVPWDLDSASTTGITEATAQAGPPSTRTIDRGQDVNTCQIFHKQVNVSYVKQSVIGQVTADATTALVDKTEAQAVDDEVDFQIMANLKQLGKNIEKAFLEGTYAQSTSATVAAQTGGVIAQTSSNSVAAGTTVLTKALIDELLRDMVGNGAELENAVIFCNAFQKQKLSDIFGYAPTDRNVGGVNIKQIETDFGMLGVTYAPAVTTSVLAIIEMSVCKPVYCPVPGKGVLFYEELAKVGAGIRGQLYGQIGLDYGPEEFHGKITGLTTS